MGSLMKHYSNLENSKKGVIGFEKNLTYRVKLAI